MARSSLTASLLAVVLGSAACGARAVPAPTTTPKASTVRTEAAPAFGASSIDVALRAEWSRLGLEPAVRADDATFLRRVYVDVVGTVPPLDVTTRFIADPSPTKRTALVDALLGSPEYAEHWMNYWDDVLMGRDTRGNLVDRASFRRWLHARFAANAPWDRMVNELVAASGENGDDSAVNWTLRFEQNPQDLGGTASRVFLGLQIQCAQCHDHKTESWKQDDFRRFSSAFLHAKLEFVDGGKSPGMLRRVALVDSAGAPPRFAKRAETAPIVRSRATALDGTDLERGAGTRSALATWITSKNNPWFAKAFVNRMWGHFLGRGFVEPIDDLRPSNPAVMPALLDRIAADFVAHDFDVRWLIRTICNTDAYQRAAGAPTKADPENRLWARFQLVPLGPEELLNAVFRVTDLEETARRAGVVDLETIRRNVYRSYSVIFDVDEEDDTRQYTGTIAQALSLLNGELVGKGSRALAGSTLGELTRGSGTDAAKIDSLALRVLGRHATPEEQARWGTYITTAADREANVDTAGSQSAGTPKRRGPLDRLGKKRVASSPEARAWEDVLWAMLNSSEFTFNH